MMILPTQIEDSYRIRCFLYKDSASKTELKSRLIAEMDFGAITQELAVDRAHLSRFDLCFEKAANAQNCGKQKANYSNGGPVSPSGRRH
jgi:hypothetical protein